MKISLLPYPPFVSESRATAVLSGGLSDKR